MLEFGENSNKTIGLLHILFTVFISFYAFITKKSWLDYVYIIYTFLIILSWTFYNGECFITYYYKKQDNTDYIAGEDCTNISDIDDLLFNSKELTFTIITISIFLLAISEFIVLKRNNFSKYLYFSFPLCEIIYTMLLRTQNKLYENKSFLFLQDIFKFYFIISLLYILITIIRRNYK